MRAGRARGRGSMQGCPRAGVGRGGPLATPRTKPRERILTRREQAMRVAPLLLALCVHVAESVKDISHLTKVNPPGGVRKGSLLNRKTLPAMESMPPDPAAFLVDVEVEGTKDGQSGQSLGSFTLQVNPTWSPNGAARFKELLDEKFFDNTKFYEVIDGSQTRGLKMVQGGIGATPEANEKWGQSFIKDDPKKVSNGKGSVVFSQLQPNERTTQIMIHLADNSRMFDGGRGQALTPFAQVVDGLDVVESLEATPAIGDRDDDAIDKALKHGNPYLDDIAPGLAYIKTARVRTEKKKKKMKKKKMMKSKDEL